MNALLAMAWNEIKVEFSDKSTLVFFLVLPVLFTGVIGAALGNSGSSPDEDARAVVGVVNNDGGALAEAWLAAFAESDVVRGEVLTEAEALDQLGAGLVGVVVLPEGMSAQVLAGESAGGPVALTLYVDEGDNRSLSVEQGLAAINAQAEAVALAAQASVAQAEARRPFADEAERAAYLAEALTLAAAALESPAVDVRTQVGEQEASSTAIIAGGFEQSSAGQLVTWTLITLLGGSASIIEERRTGTLRRLLTTPVQRGVLLAGKIVGRLALGLVQMALLIGIGQWVFGVNWGNDLLAVAAIVLTFGLAATALGLLISTVARTTAQASGMTTIGSMLLAALGGAWWPLEITPAVYQQVVSVLPSTWAMRAFVDVMVRGQGLAEIGLELAVLVGFAVGLFALGVWRFRFE